MTADIPADTSDPTFELYVKAWKAHRACAGITDKDLEEDFDQTRQVVSFIPENKVLQILEAGGC